MMRSIYTYWSGLIVAVLAIGFSACEEATEWELAESTAPTLVVESIITNKLEHQTIQLSLSYSALNDTALTVDDAVVSVDFEGESHPFFSNPTSSGTYISESPFAAMHDKEYELSVFWNGESYSAKAKMGFVTAIEDLIFSPEMVDSFSISQIAPPYHPIEQAYFVLDLDWSHIVASDSSKARLYSYTFNELQTGQFISTAAEKIVFPKGTIIDIKKYGIDEDFGIYMRGLISETEWQGGVNEDNSNTPVGNISNGAFGYFSVCQLLTRTVIAE